MFSSYALVYRYVTFTVVVVSHSKAATAVVFLIKVFIVWSLICRKKVKNVDHCFPKSKMTS